MSMSTYVKGIRPPDETWLKMKAIWDACEAAKIGIPAEVLAYFNHETPDPVGVVVDIKIALREFKTQSAEHVEIDVAKLPAHVRFVRFTNSW